MYMCVLVLGGRISVARLVRCCDEIVKVRLSIFRCVLYHSFLSGSSVYQHSVMYR